MRPEIEQGPEAVAAHMRQRQAVTPSIAMTIPYLLATEFIRELTYGPDAVPSAAIRTVLDGLDLAAFPARGTEWIFTDEAGKPLRRGTFNRIVWRPGRAAAGLPEVGMHDLRHFYASLLSEPDCRSRWSATGSVMATRR